ncbi:hypothetical protein B488_12740 [Liberibacter crescens BT-1]|uniref:Uncharacterized protein n=1 Tax=Liberibacter crescens (strain BT-1) TaxID=1215343 RepID=L0EY06_LIBCB|nr:hypothetical protein [Liberibacter crescens]AGA65266.1 hypothetical protein B488_12740 [Liberibacter crescens BT-1]AMC13202.1 hypothetical protein RL73_06435 [Liberibacter crescens]
MNYLTYQVYLPASSNFSYKSFRGVLDPEVSLIESGLKIYSEMMKNFTAYFINSFLSKVRE